MSKRYLGIVAQKRQAYEDAESLMREALELGRQAQSDFVVSGALVSLARLDLELKNFDRAKSWLEQALSVGMNLGGHYRLTVVYGLLASVAREQDRCEEARPLLSKAREICEEYNMLYRIALCDLEEGLLHERLKEFDTALVKLETALEVFKRLGAQEERITKTEKAIGRVREKLQEISESSE